MIREHIVRYEVGVHAEVVGKNVREVIQSKLLVVQLSIQTHSIFRVRNRDKRGGGRRDGVLIQ